MKDMARVFRKMDEAYGTEPGPLDEHFEVIEKLKKRVSDGIAVEDAGLGEAWERRLDELIPLR